MISNEGQFTYNILDLGFNKLLVKISSIKTLLDIPPEMTNVFSSGVAPKNLLAGELLEFIDTGQAGISGLGDLSSEIRFWAGDTFENRTSAPFRVDQDGNVILASAILSGSIDIGGSDATSFHVDSSGNMWLGAATFALAPGKFSNTGILTATAAVIDGTSTIAGITGTQISYVATSTADSVPTGLAYSTGGISTGSDGTQLAYVVLTWNAVSSNTFDHYLVRYKKVALTYYTFLPTTTNTITIEGLTPNVSYNFGVASVNRYGTVSTFSSDISQTTSSDTTAPATVTAGSATAGIQYVIVEWTHNTDSDLASYNIYRSETNDSGTAVLIGNCRTNYFIDGGRTGGTPYYYWIKAVDTSGNVSASFSTVKSATPTNVESDDIVTLAGSKVLIDGTVYLSNWRHASDLTKIDGGDIYASSVTTSQLNFTPVQTNNVIASINASVEGITIDADNLTISAATTFASGYDPTGRVLSVGGTYNSAATGARVRIFPDANTGIQIIDDVAADVFKVLVGGANVGDVIIGNYTGNQGIFYDKSENSTTFAGTLSGASGTFGTITSGIITGVTITGSIIKTIENFTCGEHIDPGNAVCLKSGYSSAIYSSADTYTTNFAPATNYGTETTMKIGMSDGKYYYGYVKFDMGSVPDAEHIQKAELHFRTISESGLMESVTVKRITETWAEDTLTWNTGPAVISDTDELSSYTTYANPGTLTDHYIDITDMVRNWKTGTYDNFGLRLTNLTNNKYINIATKEHATIDYRISLRITVSYMSDGKIYKTDSDDYNLCRNVMGIATQEKDAEEVCQVQVSSKNTDVSCAPGDIYYIATSSGGITNSVANQKRLIKIGTGSNTNELLIEKSYSDVFISNISSKITTGGTNHKYGVPSDTKYIVMQYGMNIGSAYSNRGNFRLDLTAINYQYTVETSSVSKYFETTISYVNNGFVLTINSGNAAVDVTNYLEYIVYFYR